MACTHARGAPDFGGIAEALNNPLQTIRDDFGNARADHIFSAKDTLSAVYTVDDSADFTPTATNAYSTDITTLREQVASLDETHVFSPAAVNVARIGYSRASYYFTGEPTPGSPAHGCPAFFPGTPLELWLSAEAPLRIPRRRLVLLAQITAAIYRYCRTCSLMKTLFP